MTLVELMIAMGIFGLVSVGLVFTHLFCLRQDELVNSKLGASDQSRRGFDLLLRDVRSAKVWEVGNANAAGTTFTPIALGTAQQGNALWLSYDATTNYNAGVRYFFDTSNMANKGGKLYRKTMSTGKVKLLADYLTNNMFFAAEDYRGVTQSNHLHKGIIRAKMEFAQYEYPLTKVGPNYYYNYYKMEFKLSSHVPDGP